MTSYSRRKVRAIFRGALYVGIRLSEDRLSTCPGEYVLAKRSWGGFLDRIHRKPGDKSFVLRDSDETDALKVALAEGIDQLNAKFGLPIQIDVVAESCGQPNAFYNGSTHRITFCTEEVPYLKAIYASHFDPVIGFT